MSAFLAALFYVPRRYWWGVWSRLYRAVFHRKYRCVEVRPGDLQYVAGELSKLRWVPDGPKELWDACGDPRRFQYFLDEVNAGRPQPPGALDCDDFAAWAAEATSCGPECSTCLLAVTREAEDGSVHGHVVCVVATPGRLFHVGNWGMYGPFLSLRDLLLCFVRSTKAKRLVAWAVIDKNTLLPVNIGKTLPSVVFVKSARR